MTGDRSGTWITGTPGFASPEACVGAVPSAAIDVFGLGATLRWMLTGGHSTTLPQDAEIEDLIGACTADDPRARPNAASVAKTLAALTLRLGDDPEEAILTRLAAGERLEFVSDSSRHAAMQRLAARQRRLLATFPNLLEVPDTVPTTPAGLLKALHNAQRALRHFPQHGPTLQWRGKIADAARKLLASAAGTISGRQREEEYEDAERWLEDTVRLTRALLQLPCRHPIPGTADPRTAGQLQRDPIAFLQQLQNQLGEAKAELDSAIAVIDSAEKRLDLVAAEAAIDAMAERYGGSSPTAARRRDQLHRLAFYLDRVASAQPNVERLGQSWDKNALAALAQFVADCARPPYHLSGNDLSTPLGLRSLQVTLVNLAEEFPHLYVRSGPPLDALTGALQHTSDLAWELVVEARRHLDTVPVPVRPMQIMLGRLDTFRILEALIDRPEHPRSQLLDSIESLRLKFEQARSARDQLAVGAEHAMSRGHWTTGLFDMERAVAGLNPNDDAEREEARRLEERLAEARLKKRELEVAVRRNVELGNHYGMLQDDATSSFQERLEALTKRRNYLQFLTVNLPAERAQLYARDLREVELQIAFQQAGLAETEFDATEDPAERLQLARDTLERLESSPSTAEFGDEPPGRLQRLLEHWRTVILQCQRDEQRQQAERELRGRTRRRMIAGGVFSLVVTLTAVGWAAGPWLWGIVSAAQTAEAVTYEELEQRARSLPADQAQRAERLLATVRSAVAARAPFDTAAWHDVFAAALVDFASTSKGDDATQLRTFAGDCWRTAMQHAMAAADEHGAAALRTADDELAQRVRASGIRSPR